MKQIKILLVHNIKVYQNDNISSEELVYFSEINALEKRLGEKNIFKYIAMSPKYNKLSLLFNIWYDIGHYFKIKKLVKKHNIDIVHVHNFFPLLTPSIFYGAKSAGASTIQTLHNYKKYCIKETFFYMGGSCVSCPSKSFWHGIKKRCYRGSLFKSLLSTIVNRFYSLINYEKKIDAYFVLSNIQKNLILEFDKTKTLKNKTFIKPNFIKQIDLDINPSMKRDYIFAGRLEYQKGVQFLFDFWKSLPRSFVLNVIGSGTLEDQIDENRWPHIKHIPKIGHEEVLKHISRAKFIIDTSLMYETFSLTTLEAMGLGTPVIAFNYGTRKEYIKNNKNGLIVKFDNFNEVIKKSKSIISKEYSQMCKEAKLTASSYSEEAVISKQIELYQKVLLPK
jgi:glycosyltransferase involved in cell wall biosynthesis